MTTLHSQRQPKLSCVRETCSQPGPPWWAHGNGSAQSRDVGYFCRPTSVPQGRSGSGVTHPRIRTRLPSQSYDHPHRRASAHEYAHSHGYAGAPNLSPFPVHLGPRQSMRPRSCASPSTHLHPYYRPAVGHGCAVPRPRRTSVSPLSSSPFQCPERPAPFMAAAEAGTWPWTWFRSGSAFGFGSGSGSGSGSGFRSGSGYELGPGPESARALGPKTCPSALHVPRAMQPLEDQPIQNIETAAVMEEDKGLPPPIPTLVNATSLPYLSDRSSPPSYTSNVPDLSSHSSVDPMEGMDEVLTPRSLGLGLSSSSFYYRLRSRPRSRSPSRSYSHSHSRSHCPSHSHSHSRLQVGEGMGTGRRTSTSQSSGDSSIGATSNNGLGRLADQTPAPPSLSYSNTSSTSEPGVSSSCRASAPPFPLWNASTLPPGGAHWGDSRRRGKGKVQQALPVLTPHTAYASTTPMARTAAVDTARSELGAGGCAHTPLSPCVK